MRQVEKKTSITKLINFKPLYFWDNYYITIAIKQATI